MSDIDTRLRDHAERWREDNAHLRVPPIPSMPTSAGGRPRVLLSVAASVVVVALLAAALVVYARSHPTRTPPDVATGTGHVPWSAVGQVPDTAYHVASLPAEAPSSMRRCTPADIRVLSVNTMPGPSSYGAGWLQTSLVLRSTAVSRCAVPHGPLAATLLSADGTKLPVDGSGFNAIGPMQPAPTRQIVAPGDVLFLTATWAADVNRVPRPDRLTIWFGQHNSRTDPVTVPLGDVAIPPHPVMTGNPSWRSAASANLSRVAPAGSIASLTASLKLPSSVPAGSVLRYFVTLSNTTDVAVPLRPCPTVAQHVDVKGARPVVSAGTIGPLNCAHAPRAIAPGRTVVFDYEVTLPTGVTGFALLGWSVIDGTAVLISAGGYAAVP